MEIPGKADGKPAGAGTHGALAGGVVEAEVAATGIRARVTGERDLADDVISRVCAARHDVRGVPIERVIDDLRRVVADSALMQLAELAAFRMKTLFVTE